MSLENWAGNLTFGSSQIQTPETVEQLQELVAGNRKVKVFGSRHSFNDVADTCGTHISLDQLPQEVTVDEDNGTVTCPASMTYGQLGPIIDDEGRALRNMASLPNVTVAGASATATHGSGDTNANLSAAVVGMEVVTADGALRTLSREEEGQAFDGMVVNLGGLGVVSAVTLETVPAFSMQQELYEEMPVAELYDNFDAIMSSSYSVSIFTDWRSGTVNQVWLKRRLLEDETSGIEDDFFGAVPAPVQRHPVTHFPPDPCNPQMGIPGPWHERLPHFRVDGLPVEGNELQAEYFVPRHHAVAALQAVEPFGDEMADLLWISEVRTVAADRLWMSPARETPVVGIHFTMNRDWPALRRLLPRIEQVFTPFDVRPHWGKLFRIPAGQVQSAYPRLVDFLELLDDFDPEGKFRNAYLDRHLIPAR